MGWYQYEGLTPGGSLVQGRIEAPGAEQARLDLMRMGLDVRQLSEGGAPPARRAGLSENDLIFFNEQLASLAQAGIALDEGLAQLARDLNSPRLKQWVEDLVVLLRQGVPMDQAIAMQEGGLPVLYSRVIRAGIESGELPATLLNLNQHLRLTNNTRRIIWEVAAYPIIVLIFGLSIMTGVMTLVVPKFIEIFRDFGTQLPALTMLVLRIGEWFSHGSGIMPPGWVVVWVLPIVLFVLWKLLLVNPAGRAFREGVTLAMPVIGGVHRASLIARFLRSVATAVSTQIPLPQAMRLSADATGSLALRRDAEWLAAEVEQGHSIFTASQSTQIVPPLFGFCVQVSTGREALHEAIATLSKSYENRAMHGQSLLRLLFFPAIIIFVGGMLAIIIVSLFLPLVHLINSVSSGG